METRTAKIIINTPGGTASKGSKTYKISLPTSWIEQLGIDSADRNVELVFNGEKITITKACTAKQFAEKKKALGHDVKCLRYYSSNSLCTLIYADFTDETLAAENHIDNLVKTAFGKNTHPDWDDFTAFLEERCIPKGRSGLREYLESIGVESYSPIEIIQKTQGRMAEDNQWLELEDF